MTALDPTERVERALMRHFLAGLAYRTQKAVRGAPDSFESFRADTGTRTPRELVRHMTSVLGYARTFFRGGSYTADPLPTIAAELDRFHQMLRDLSSDLEALPFQGTTAERMLQGPFSDAMTHAGQLAMLRRLSGSPVAPENFMKADISTGNVGPDQPPPVAWGGRHGTWDPHGVPGDD